MKPTALFSILFLGFFACKTPADVDPETPEPVKGTPTEIGQPIGAAFSRTIGPEGGTMATPDNKVKFTFPAGAVSKPTALHIQPIENKAFGGNGIAYSISAADNAPLLTEAQITLHYTPEDIDGTAPEAIRIAHQDKEGVWQGHKKVKVDKVNKTVTVPVTHLAHWAFYEQFTIECDCNELAPVEQSQLTVKYQYGHQDDVPGDTLGNLLVQLTPLKVLSASRLVRWTINGITDGSIEGDNYANVGQITEDRSWAKASYTAPTREPDTNPVAIGAEIDLKQFGHLILVQNIRIESPSSLSIDGSTDSNPNVMLTVNGNVLQGAIADAVGMKMLSFYIEDFHGVGIYSFGPNGGSNIVARISPLVVGTHGYFEDNGAWVSGNVTVNITGYKGKGHPMSGKISGTFFKQKTPFAAGAKFKGVPVVL
ncbi:MAG: hypothetical protein U0X91_10115 [Spirosomataceae bacterium]